VKVLLLGDTSSSHTGAGRCEVMLLATVLRGKQRKPEFRRSSARDIERHRALHHKTSSGRTKYRGIYKISEMQKK
jgi:hypothetical protein